MFEENSIDQNKLTLRKNKEMENNAIKKSDFNAYYLEGHEILLLIGSKLECIQVPVHGTLGTGYTFIRYVLFTGAGAKASLVNTPRFKMIASIFDYKYPVALDKCHDT